MDRTSNAVAVGLAAGSVLAFLGAAWLLTHFEAVNDDPYMGLGNALREGAAKGLRQLKESGAPAPRGFGSQGHVAGLPYRLKVELVHDDIYEPGRSLASSLERAQSNPPALSWSVDDSMLDAGSSGADDEDSDEQGFTVTTMDTGKFHVDGTGPWGRNVKIRYPVDLSWDAVQKIVDRFPGGTSLDKVERALAKAGASFAAWSDGQPGYVDVYI